MAKIEMDLSEFKIMEENKKLLEQSLERERDLQKQIKTLNEEKIKALEDAKMKVVKTIKHEERKYLGGIDDLRLRHAIRSLSPNRNLDKNQEDTIFYKLKPQLMECFKTYESVSFPVDETVLVGLDEVKKEIRESLEREFIEDIIYSKEINKKSEELYKINSELVLTNRELSERTNSLNDQLILVTDQKEEIKKHRDELNKRIERIIKSLTKSGWFVNFKIVSEIKDILTLPIDKL